MNKVFLDDGHGTATAGKRTPTLPGGSVTKENDFNRKVINCLEEKLKADKRFLPIQIAPELEDIPLATRVTRANQQHDSTAILVSVHYNALNGVLGEQGGVEILHSGSQSSQRLAKCIHTQVIKNTSQKDRGVKFQELYLLKNAKMPAVLCELGFMDNLTEAHLMTSETFIKECAEEIYLGIVDYYNLGGK